MSTIKKTLPRPKQSNCEICQKSFSILLKQHQCKRCQRAICFDCGKYKAIIVDYDLKQQHRVCTFCKEESLFIQEIIKKEQLSINKNSLITKQWLKYYPVSFKEQLINDEYYTILQQSKKNISQQIQEQLKQVSSIVSMIRMTYRFSLLELDYYLSKDLPENSITLHVSSILQSLFYSHPKIKLTTSLVQLIIFLLYFHSQPYVYFFINCYREEMSLSRFLDQEKPLQSEEIDFLQEIGKKNYLIEPSDLLYYRKYLERHSNAMLSTMFVKYLNIPCLLFIFDHILKFKDLFELEKIVSLLGQVHLKDFKLKGLDDDYFFNQILKNTKLSILKEYLSKEDRIRMNSKRNVHSKSDSPFLLIMKDDQDPQNDVKQLLYLLEDCVLKQLPMNSFHMQLITKMNFKQQQIINDLIGVRKDKHYEYQENEIFDCKMETVSESSTQIKLEKSELVDQNKMLMEEITNLKEQLLQFKQDRQKEQEYIEQLLNRQESIQIKMEKTVEKQITLIEGEPHQINELILQRKSIAFDQLDETTQTNLDYESIIFDLKEQLEKQKDYYEKKLQSSASRQQQAIAKILSDLSGSKMESSQVLWTEPRKKSESVFVSNPLNQSNIELLKQYHFDESVQLQPENQTIKLSKSLVLMEQQPKKFENKIKQNDKEKEKEKECIIQ